jgi:hypothetical protein
MILGTLVAVTLVSAAPTNATDRQAESNAEGQPQREPSREMRRPLREREFLRRTEAEDGTSADWRNRRQLTEEERLELRRDLERARREFYRDQKRQRRDSDPDSGPSIPERPNRPTPPAEPVQGANK